jgi:hypothetical protein
MDAEQITLAHDALLAVARDGPFGPPAAGSWPAPLIVAHLIATDRLIATALVDLSEGRGELVDNSVCQSSAYLAAIVASCDSFSDLLDTYAHSGRELAALVGSLDPALGDAALPVRFYDDGAVGYEGPFPIARLIGPFHSDGHAAQLTALRP